MRGSREASRFNAALEKALKTKQSPLSPVGEPTFRPRHSITPRSLAKEAYQVKSILSPAPIETNPRSPSNLGSPALTKPGHFEPFIQEASRSFGIEEPLIRAVIKAESNFDPRAKSRAGAVGLMQLLPSTGAELGVRDLYDPRENILGGTRYLATLLDRYGGDPRLALAAYNWGPGNLEKPHTGFPPETERYIQRVFKYLETLTA
jgi:soluble lytic murein transglycosylase-like protein